MILKWLASLVLCIVGIAVISVAKHMPVIYLGAFIVLVGCLIANSARRDMTRRLFAQVASKRK